MSTREHKFLKAIGWADLETDRAPAELTGKQLFDAMAEVSRRHAELLQEMSEVQVLALDPCPRCMGTVIASEVEARCATGCGWSYRQHGPTPLASRRADP